MSDHDDGGPAFPCMPPQDTAAGAATGYPYPNAGMTLRDRFALEAVGSLILGAAFNREAFKYRLAAEEAYAIADEMLRARRLSVAELNAARAT